MDIEFTSNTNDNASMSTQYSGNCVEKGQALFEEGRIDEALSVLTIGLLECKDSETKSSILFTFGLIYFMGKGDLAKANEYFDACLQEKPHHSDALFNRSAVKLQQKDIKGALEDLELYIKINPNDAEGYQNRGFAKLHAGDTNAALQDFNLALTIDPENYSVLNNRATVYLSYFNDTARAMEDVEKAIKILPTEFLAYKTRGCIKATMGNYQAAITDFNYCISLNIEAQQVVQELIDEAMSELKKKSKKKKK